MQQENYNPPLPLSDFWNNLPPNASWAEAPGRLDIMGGIADYSGSLVLEMPIGLKARVAVVPRNDGCFRAFSPQAKNIGARTEVFFKIKSIVELKQAILANPGSEWSAYLFGCALMLAQEKKLPLQHWDFYLDSDTPIGKGLSSSAAIEIATMKALGRASNLDFKGTELPRLCQRVENEVVGASCGLMDQLTCFFGKEGELLPIHCQPDQVQSSIPIPEDIHFAGVDSGVRHHVGGNAYQRARTAAFMGYSYIAEHNDTLNGYLANIAPTAFNKQYVNLIPESITGAFFLQEGRKLIDPFSLIEEDVVYYPRACASFPVFEHQRVKEFIGLIHKCADESLKKMGQLMFEAHKGYSACGLGHPVTDQIINAIRNAPSTTGLLGARVSGGGCGGAVTVLCKGADAITHLRERMSEILNPVVIYK